MKQIIYKTFDYSVTEEDGRWELVRNRREILRNACAIGVLGVLFWVASAQGLAAKLSFDEAGAIFNQGASKLMALFMGGTALLLLCFLGIKKWRTGWTLDTNARTLKLRSGVFSFDELGVFRVLSVGSYKKLYAVTGAGDSKFMLRARLKGAAQLEEMASKLNALIRAAPGTSVNMKPFDASPVGYGFKAKIAFAGGTFWIIGGFFFFPNLYWVSVLDPNGPRTPVWVDGLFAVALGLYFLWRGRRARRS